MKRIFAIILSTVLLLGALAACGTVTSFGEVRDGYGSAYELSDDGTVFLRYDSENSTSPILVIPDGVTSVAKDAFAEAEGLTEIIFPESLKTVDFSFSEMIDIERVVIPAWIENFSLETCQFSGCYSLQSVTILCPVKETRIPDACFASCESLASVLLPDSVVSVGRESFYGCTSLSLVGYASQRDVKYYDSGLESAAQGCPVVYIAEGFREIYNYSSFDWCRYLWIPSTVEQFDPRCDGGSMSGRAVISVAEETTVLPYSEAEGNRCTVKER